MACLWAGSKAGWMADLTVRLWVVLMADPKAYWARPSAGLKARWKAYWMADLMAYWRADWLAGSVAR
jgi:hypothetical protein